MRRRSLLASVAAAAAGATAGCLNAVDSTQSSDTTATTRTTRTTTTDPCATDIEVSNPPEKPDPLRDRAGYVSRRLERTVAPDALTVDGTLNTLETDVDSVFDGDPGVGVVVSVTAEFETTGDGPNATTADVHTSYLATYHLTDRRVVRESGGGDGPTGTMVCW